MNLSVLLNKVIKEIKKMNLKFAEDTKRKLAILKKEFDAGKIYKTAYESEKLNISNEYPKKQVDITIAQSELDIYKRY
jgi:hypothetical protein